MVFYCKTSLRLSLLEIHPHLRFPLKSQEMICAPCIHFHPHNSRAFKRGNSFSVFQKTVQSLLPLLLLYYPFILSAITSTSFSVALYIVGEKKWKLFFFFLEVLTLITVPTFVYSSVFTDWQGLEFPRLVHASLLLQPHWYPALDLWLTATSHKLWNECSFSPGT